MIKHEYLIEVRPQQLAIGGKLTVRPLIYDTTLKCSHPLLPTDKTRADHLLVLEPFARLEKNELPLNRPYWSDPSGFLESLRECNEAKDPMKLEHGNLPRMVLVVIEEKVRMSAACSRPSTDTTVTETSHRPIQCMERGLLGEDTARI